jgi:adenine-specific DNA-methyltransferase
VENVKFRQLYVERKTGETSLDRYDQILLPDEKSRRLTPDEIAGREPIAEGKRYQLTSLLSDGQTSSPQKFEFQGKTYLPRAGTHWKTSVEGLARLAANGRIEIMGSVLRYRRFVDDFSVVPITDRWESMQLGVELTYVVQTSTQVATLPLDDHRPRRLGARPDVRQRHDGVCGRAVGTALDHD